MSVQLLALRLKVSMSLTNFQPSPARQTLWSRKTDFQTTLSSRSQLESSAGKRSLPAQKSRHQDKNCVQLYYMVRGWREARLQRAKTTTFPAEQRSFQGSTESLVSQLHARKKWWCYGNHNDQKLRFECSKVTIVRNRTVKSQRVKVKDVFSWHSTMPSPAIQRTTSASSQQFWGQKKKWCQSCSFVRLSPFTKSSV